MGAGTTGLPLPTAAQTLLFCFYYFTPASCLCFTWRACCLPLCLSLHLSFPPPPSPQTPSLLLPSITLFTFRFLDVKRVKRLSPSHTGAHVHTPESPQRLRINITYLLPTGGGWVIFVSHADPFFKCLHVSPSLPPRTNPPSAVEPLSPSLHLFWPSHVYLTLTLRWPSCSRASSRPHRCLCAPSSLIRFSFCAPRGRHQLNQLRKIRIAHVNKQRKHKEARYGTRSANSGRCPCLSMPPPSAPFFSFLTPARNTPLKGVPLFAISFWGRE